MVFKFLVALTLFAVATAGLVSSYHEYHSEPLLDKEVGHYDPHPHYHFDYSVHDGHTGDVKSQYETRDGDVVKGEYTLIDSDGYKRIVKYSADHDHGFNAVVEREPIAHSFKIAASTKEDDYSTFQSAPVSYGIPDGYSYGH